MAVKKFLWLFKTGHGCSKFLKGVQGDHLVETFIKTSAFLNVSKVLFNNVPFIAAIFLTVAQL